MSDSLWLYGLQPTRLLCPWDPPGKNTGVGSHSLLQGIFLTQGQTWVSWITGKFFTILATRKEYLNRNQMIWLETRFRHICDSEKNHRIFSEFQFLLSVLSTSKEHHENQMGPWVCMCECKHYKSFYILSVLNKLLQIVVMIQFRRTQITRDEIYIYNLNWSC